MAQRTLKLVTKTSDLWTPDSVAVTQNSSGATNRRSKDIASESIMAFLMVDAISIVRLMDIFAFEGEFLPGITRLLVKAEKRSKRLYNNLVCSYEKEFADKVLDTYREPFFGSWSTLKT